MAVEDAIEKIIGGFGKYQIWMLILISIGRLPAEFNLTNIVFVIPSVEYVCLDGDNVNVTNLCPCSNPIYDTSTIVNSVTTEWNLICDRTYLSSNLNTASWNISRQFGVWTYLRQVKVQSVLKIHHRKKIRYGRKIAVVKALFFTAFFGTIAAAMKNFWIFLVCRFFIGMSVGGTMLCCYVLIIELSGKSFRPYLIGLEGIAHVGAYFVQPVIAYYVREWRYLVLLTSTPWLLVIIYYWLLTESPRWLITVGKTDEAIDLLTKIAVMNNRPTEDIKEIISKIDTGDTDKEKRGTYLDLFRTYKIRRYTILNAIMWMCCSHAFFGMNQYIGLLDGNLYLNVMYSALFHMFGLVLVVMATLWLKRRTSVLATFSITSISLILIIFIPINVPWAKLTSAVIGQTSMYVSFILVYLYAAEVFPTFIRNSAMGFASVFARVGSFVAPFVVNIGVQWVSMLIFASVAFMGGFVCIFLPETKGIVLKNTIAQAESDSFSEQVKPTQHSNISNVD